MKRRVFVLFLTVLAFTAAAGAQLSTSAYRALGQPDLRQNAPNTPAGTDLFMPLSAAVDATASPVHLYIADSRNNRVLAWRDLTQALAGAPADLVLGQPNASSTGPYGVGVTGLFVPSSVAVQPGTGNLFVADFGSNRVLRFPSPLNNAPPNNPDHVYGQASFNSRTANAGGVTAATLQGPRAIAFDAAGNLWVSDSGNNRVLRFPAAVLNSDGPAADLVIGQTSFTAGKSNHGATGVSAAGLDNPGGLAFDSKGSLYVSDSNNARLLIFPAPLASGEAATGVLGQANLTSRTTGPLNSPQGLALDAHDHLYAADAALNRVLEFDTLNSTPTRIYGQPDNTSVTPNTGSAPRASAGGLFGPADVKVLPDGSVLIVDTNNNRLLQFPGISTTATGVAGQRNLTANSPNQAKPAGLNAPYKVVIDYSQSPFALYVSDSGNNRILGWRDAAHFQNGAPADMVIGQFDLTSSLANGTAPGGTRSASSLFFPRGLAVDSSGNLWVADSGNNRVLRFPRPVDQGAPVTADIVYGQPDFTTSTVSSVTASLMNQPWGVSIAPNGNVFVSDTGNSRVLEFQGGAPSGAAAFRVYGQPDFLQHPAAAAFSAQTMLHPEGLFIDRSFNLYVADTGASRLLIFTNVQAAPTAGTAASIVIGQPTFTVSTGGAGTKLKSPADVSVGGDGSIFIADQGNNRVLIFPPLLQLPLTDAKATGVFGQAALEGTAPNFNSPDGLATPQGLAAPAGVYVDRQSTLFIADSANNRVIQVLKAATILNGASFIQSAPLAPGVWTSIFGAALASDTKQAGSTPFPTNLGSRQIIVENIPAPLYYVSPGQINFLIPGAAPVGNDRFAVILSDTGEPVAGGVVPVAAASPGLFASAQNGTGLAAAFNQDGKLNSAANPAPKGSVVQLFGTGQGAVNPPVADGQPAPSGALAQTTATPTTDGVACLSDSTTMCAAVGAAFGEIQFSGLAPGLVGVWQINVKIPDNTPSGLVPVRVVIHSIPSNLVEIAVK